MSRNRGGCRLSGVPGTGYDVTGNSCENSSAYIEFMHYAERLYAAAETMAPEHVQKPVSTHTH